MRAHDPATSPYQHPPCNACGLVDSDPHCVKNGLGLVRCRQCQLVFVAKRPDDSAILRIYDSSYFRNPASRSVGYTDYLGDEANIRRTARRRARILEQWMRPGRLIDFGCATGFFINEMSRRGWQVEGVDVSDFATSYARLRFGHPIHTGSIESAPLPDNAFDLATLYDVIEHVPDPRACLRTVARTLKPGGVVQLSTPDIDSLPARIAGQRWIGYKLSAEHLYYFSATTLSDMLRKVGFEILDIRYIGKHVSTSLFLDRLAMYFPHFVQPLQAIERWFSLSRRSLYVNPFDIVCITARRSGS